MTVTVDASATAAAIAGVSEVSLRVTNAGDRQPTVQWQFGDGTPGANGAAVVHVYAVPGTYTVTATIVDGGEKRTTAPQPVVVKSLERAWFAAGANASAGRFEVRRFDITSQRGADVRGVYARAGAGEQALTGRVGPGRALHLATADGVEQFDGTVSADVDDPAVPLHLIPTGGTSSGRSLPFKIVPIDIAGPAPRAVLALGYGPNKEPIRGHDVTVDASGSTGDSLWFGIAYGDGAFSNEPVSKHGFDTNADMIAQVIVVDRFGRADIASQKVGGTSAELACYGGEFYLNAINPANGRMENRRFHFDQHVGRRVSGSLQHPDQKGNAYTKFTGQLSGENGIQLKSEDGTFELNGQISVDYQGPLEYGFLRVLVQGGTANGQTLAFHRHWCS